VLVLATVCTFVPLSRLSALRHLVREGASAERMVVRSRTERLSHRADMRGVTAQDLDLISGIPQVARRGEVPLAAAALLARVPQRLRGGGVRDVVMRGVDRVAYDLHHDEIKIDEGHPPEPGTPGVLVSAALLDRFEGLDRTGAVWVGEERWPVVGVFHGVGMSASELWCDRGALMRALGQTGSSIVTVALAGESAQTSFAAEITRRSAGRLEAQPEDAYVLERLRDFRPFPTGATGCVVVTLLLAALGFVSTSRRAGPGAPLLAFGVAGAIAALASGLLRSSSWTFTDHWTVVPYSFSFRLPLQVAAGVALARALGEGLSRLLQRGSRAGGLIRVAGAGFLASVVTLVVSIVGSIVGGHRSLAALPSAIVMPTAMFDGLLRPGVLAEVQVTAHAPEVVHWFEYHTASTPTWKEPVSVMAISPQYLEIFGSGGTMPPPDEYRAWQADPAGLIAVGQLFDLGGWKIGDPVSLRIDGRALDGTVRGFAGGSRGGAAPDKMIAHYEHVEAFLPPERRGQAIMINVLCPSFSDEEALTQRLSAALRQLPARVLAHDGVYDYLIVAPLIELFRALAVPLALLLLAAFAALEARAATLVPGVALGTAATYLAWRVSGPFIGGWILLNVIVLPSFALIGCALTVLLGAPVALAAARRASV
jgi:hypothetical protein